jgi:uncharacterized membrane protein YgcG
MKKTVAQLLLILTVLSLASCTIEKRVYSSGYHISWMHTVEKGVLQDASQDVAQDVAQDASQELSQNLETDVSLDLSKKLCKSQDAETLSDTITPNNKDDDYFGQKNYTRDEANNVVPNTKNTKPQDISELKKETKDNFIAALIGFGGWGISLGLLSMNNWSTLDDIKSAIFFIVLGTACAILFLIFLPVAIFRLFKLAFLKMRGKPDDYKINQPKNQ